MISSFLIFVSGPVSAFTYDDVKAGNKLYQEKQYDKAIEEYSKGKDGEDGTDILNFNTGTALYRQGKYDEAVDAFTNSLITEDKDLEAMANYNIANSKFRLGSEKAKEDLSNAINLYKQSLDHYKRAIEMDEANADARYNHELVEKRMKVLMDRLKKEQEQQKEKDGEEGEQKQKGQEEGQDETKGKQADSATGEESEEQQKPEGSKTASEKQEENTEEASSSQGDEADSGENAGAEAEEGEKMTQEEANMLLEAFGEEESLDTLEKRGRAQFRGVLKNW